MNQSKEITYESLNMLCQGVQATFNREKIYWNSPEFYEKLPIYIETKDKDKVTSSQ